MADDTTRKHLARFVIGDGLFRHKGDRLACPLEIVLSPRIALGKSGGAEFEIGQIDVDKGVDALERRNKGIAARIVDDGHRRPVEGERFRNEIGDVVGRHEVDIVGAHLFQFPEDPGQLFGGHALAALGARDFVILAKDAAQGTAAEKDRPAPVLVGDGRLFEGMKIVLRHGEPLHAAAAERLFSVRPALNGAKPAFHRAIITSCS